MLACSLALHLGRELPYMYRLTQYWRMTSCINSWTCRYFEKSAPCFASSLNLRVLQGLHDSDFWKAATMSRKLASSHSFEKTFNIQDDVNEMFQTFAEKFSVNNFDPIKAVDWLKFIKTFMLCTVTGFQNQHPVITVDNVFHYRKKSELLMSVFQNPHFHSLLNQIQGHVSHFTAADNAELFVCLVALNISCEHSIMQELISLFHNENYPMSLNDLALIVHGIQSSNFRSDLFFIRVCMPRLQKVYETNIFIKNTSCTLPRLAILSPLFRFIQCSEMRDWYIERLLSMAEDDNCMNLDSVRNIFTMFIKSSFRSLPLYCMVRLAILCFKETEKRLYELKPHDIAVVAGAGWQCADKELGLTTQALHILERIHFLALRMLKNVSTSTSLTETLLLLSGVRLKILNGKEREQFGTLVAEHLDEANVHELIRIAHLTPINKILIETYYNAFNAAVSRNMDKIMDTPSVFWMVSNCYASFPVSPLMYRTFLCRMHKTQMMLEPKGFVYLAQLIMYTFSEDEPFPKLIIDKTESMISQFSLFDIAVILRGLDFLNRNRSTHKIVIDLHIQLERAFVQKIETTKLQKLCDATDKLSSLKNSKAIHTHAYKFNLLFDRMAKLTQFMTTDEFHQIVRLICKRNLYHTVVLEALTQYFIRHNEAVMESSFVLLVQAIAKSGYEPQEHSVFTKLCIEKTLNHFNKMDIKEQISLALYLSMLQICPQEILCRIFSFDYLALLDKHRAQHKLNMSLQIMYLNRCAVIEYPQLNIPWFHEGFGAELITLYFDRIDRCFPSLFKALSQVLGGPNFFQKNVLTQYFHPICAELFLDENKRPVSYLKAKQVQAGNAPYQPIAIVPVAEQSTRSIKNGDEKLIGIMKTDIRQLEIIGYKVVVIYFTEWNSLAMCDQDERVNYLNEKIFTV